LVEQERIGKGGSESLARCVIVFSDDGAARSDATAAPTRDDRTRPAKCVWSRWTLRS